MVMELEIHKKQVWRKAAVDFVTKKLKTAGTGGVPVELLNVHGDVVGRTLTLDDGSYEFDGVRPGKRLRNSFRYTFSS